MPRGKLFGLLSTGNRTSTLYYVVLAIFVVGFLVIYRTVHSPFGQVLKAIRENEPRAISLGYDVDALQAAGLRVVRRAGRVGRLDQDTGARLRDVDRCALEHVRAW